MTRMTENFRRILFLTAAICVSVVGLAVTSPTYAQDADVARQIKRNQVVVHTLVVTANLKDTQQLGADWTEQADLIRDVAKTLKKYLGDVGPLVANPGTSANATLSGLNEQLKRNVKSGADALNQQEKRTIQHNGNAKSVTQRKLKAFGLILEFTPVVLDSDRIRLEIAPQ